MNRDDHLKRLRDESSVWDVVVIGGGASGLGAAVDAASRGLRTLLLEQHDFAKGTSSRSTKLIHGGVRYLKQGNIALVREALHERGILRKLAPHLVRDLEFVVPLYDWWEGPFYGLGFKMYDALAGDLGLGPSRSLSVEETIRRLPTVETDGLHGGVVYHDAQFDDARLAINLAQTLVDIGGVPINYMSVVSLQKTGDRITGVAVRDDEDPAHPVLEVRARVVINATGVYADAVRHLDEPSVRPMIRASQGVHLVLDRSFLPGNCAIMVPKTDDGRVLFAVPWHGRVLLGTTDTPVDAISLEPRALPEEIDFLLHHAARYLTRDPQPSDVLSVFAGLRPLIEADPRRSTSRLSREHVVDVSPSGLVTLTGGKWTTYRRMGADAVDAAIEIADLKAGPSATESLHIHGWVASTPAHESVYGTDEPEVRRIAAGNPTLAAPLHPRLPYRHADVVWAARREMARTLEDILGRRTRALLLDARASMECAPEAAATMAHELGRDAAWADAHVAAYRDLAKRYVL